MKTAVVLFALLIGGCSLVPGIDGVATDIGSKAHALCIEGSGPPLTGAGHVASAKVDKDFLGNVKVGPDCNLEIESR